MTTALIVYLSIAAMVFAAIIVGRSHLPKER